MKNAFLLLLLVTSHAIGQTTYEKDFDEFWKDVKDNYAYLDQQHIDVEKAKSIYSPKVSVLKNREEFIRLLENMLNEFYNGHVSLNTNLNSSNRIVPSGSDIWVEKVGNDYAIKDLRKGFGAEKCGLKIGMHITKFNDKEIGPQLNQFLPKSVETFNLKMYDYAMAMLFAGTHDKPRKITVVENGIEKDYFPDAVVVSQTENILDSRLLSPQTGYIKINNSLGNTGLIAEFDSVLDTFSKTKYLVIDLTETPGGGNTTVARAIMGRFISEKMPYQQHEFDEKEFETKRSWVEYVVPRKTKYNGKVYVLVGHWTGSMGEGIAIGFDAMKNATVIGTEMAGLLGAISNFQLSESKIGYQIPTERLYHVNGTPREDFTPKVRTENGDQTWAEVKRRLGF
ncbi:S41 family peptidase [Flavobacterium silvaticum]|uniref:Peptidase n=1 Tax=Flavobacterium silvaticum TaxID=1852020 RepID=A0A972FLY6_9FLAO|nr:S41 family peptidase [Flavobacterium silvaticum]NMH28082.1 peptidase [Flavobacterium silvaticum]